MYTEKEHDLKLCPIKLNDHDEKELFIQFFQSIKSSEDYIEKRKKYYPEDWDQVGERIKFRKLAQLKLQFTSKQIEEKIKKSDFKNITRFIGRSYDDSTASLIKNNSSQDDR